MSLGEITCEKIENVKKNLADFAQNLEGTFYFRINQGYTRNPILVLNIGNHFLEEGYPLIFPKERHLFVLTLVLTPENFISTQSFYLGTNLDDLEEWQPDVKQASPGNIEKLVLRFAKLIKPLEEIRVINLREVNHNPLLNQNLRENSIIHYLNGDYSFTSININDYSKDLDLRDMELNLKIFYEFFKDLG